MTAIQSYPTCSIKRVRRTGDNLKTILEASQSIIVEEGTLQLRHLFYRISSLGLIKKEESEYAKLSGYTMKWRREGSIPWNAFVDSTRWYHGVTTYSDLEQSLENSKKCYRRNLWQSQKVYVEIWTEKEAIAAISQQASDPFGVPVFPMRGFASGSALYSISRQIKYYQSIGKKVFIYYLGDHDPSGKCIDESIVRNLREDHGVEFNFKRIAITPDQVKTYNLPTRPTKKTDPRSKKFDGESVEIDAMPPHTIRGLITDCISQHIDPLSWKREKEIEKMEMDTLRDMVSALHRGGFDRDEDEQDDEEEYPPGCAP
jgi:hypothetical protein